MPKSFALGSKEPSTSRSYLLVVGSTGVLPAVVSLYPVTVGCSEPGTTGESDAIEKFDHDESTPFRARYEDANTHSLDYIRTHSERPLASESNIVGDYGQHAAADSGWKTSNDHAVNSLSFNTHLFCPLTILLVLQLLGANSIVLHYKRSESTT